MHSCVHSFTRSMRLYHAHSLSVAPDTYSALCLVLHRTAPLDVSKSLTVFCDGTSASASLACLCPYPYHTCIANKESSHLQDRLMAQQATTGQNLSRRIDAAHEKYQACAAEVVSELQNSRNHAMRAAFVVFNEPFLADLAVEEAPRGVMLPLASATRNTMTVASTPFSRHQSTVHLQHYCTCDTPTQGMSIRARLPQCIRAMHEQEHVPWLPVEYRPLGLLPDACGVHDSLRFPSIAT